MILCGFAYLRRCVRCPIALLHFEIALQPNDSHAKLRIRLAREVERPRRLAFADANLSSYGYMFGAHKPIIVDTALRLNCIST